MNPTPYTVGQQVYVSKQNLKKIVAHCRSLLADNPNLFSPGMFINMATELAENRIVGIVERVFFPEHNVAVKFDNSFRMQMEYDWITNLPDFGPADGIE